jgi:hypothetical protein
MTAGMMPLGKSWRNGIGAFTLFVQTGF